MSTPQVSIILPIYNVEPYLDDCLRSILAQSFRDFEVVAVNDGSTDRSLEICQRYADEDDRVHIITQPNGGLSAARNTGIRAARGAYITGIDSDDWIDVHYLAILYHLVREYGADIAITELTSEEAPTLAATAPADKIMVYDSPSALNALYANQILRDHFCGKLFRSSLFDNIEFPLGRCFEDIYTTYRTFAAATTIVRADVATYHYIRRPTSISAFSSGACRKFHDWSEGLAAQLTFLEASPESFADPRAAHAATALNFYRLKRTCVKTLRVPSPERKAVLDAINTHLRLSLRYTSARDIGYLKYLNVLRILALS